MTPLWQGVEAELRRRIAAGEHGPDGSLPTESELCTEFGVSRITVRRALETLRTDGLLTAGRGRGWRVSGHDGGQPLGLFRVTSRTGADSAPIEMETLEFGIAPHMAEPDLEATALRILRLAKSDGVPFDLVEILIAAPYASEVTAAEIADVPPARLLAQKGAELGHTDQWATAELATLADAPLDVEPGDPLMVVQRWAYEAGRPILHTTHRHPGHLVRIDVTFPLTSTTDTAPVRILRG